MPSAPTTDRAVPRIAIVGGGISGLAAAYRLSELLPHADLALLESSDRLGGILDTVSRDGFLVERSADSFQTKLPHAVDLCTRLGIADELLPTDDARRRALVVRDGKLLPIPQGFYLMSPGRLGPVLKSPILSWPGKLRLLAEPLVPRDPSTAAGADESIAAFATRRLGRETFERLVQPLVAGIYTGDATRLGMAATLPEFLAHERDSSSLLRATLRRRAAPTAEASGARYGLFAAPRNGMAAFVNAIAVRLPPNAVQLSTKVLHARRETHGRWQIDALSSLHDAPPMSRRFDALILAVPAPAAAVIIRSADPALAAALAQIEYASCAVVSMACRRKQISHGLDSFGFVVPQIENRPIIAASFASQKFPGRAPADNVLIRVFVGGALRPELACLPDVELEELVRRELASLIDLRGEPLWTDIARWHSTMPQYYVGHVDRVAHIEKLAARHAMLALAGNALHGVGIPQCIRSGEEAAERIAAHLNSSH